MKKLFIFWFIILCVKLLLAAILPISTDESYYWVWSKHLQLSYYDHPPFVAWLIWLGHPLELIGNAIRWPTVLLGHISVWIWILIVKDFFTEKKIYWWLAVFFFSPLTGFGSLVATPDVPLVFFWTLSLYVMLQAFRNHKWYWYALLGLSLGLGFCAKYHIVLFVFSMLLWITFEKKWAEVRWRGVGLTILVGLIFSLPVVVWNYQNEFISFLFQLKHGLRGGAYKMVWTYEYLIGQVLIIFPPFIYFLFRPRLDKAQRWLFYFAWFPLLFFLLTSFKGGVEANWPVIAYPALYVIIVSAMERARWVWINSVFWCACFVFIAIQTFYPWLPVPAEELKTNEKQRYAKLIQNLDKYQPFFGSNYQMASYLWYATKKPIYKLQGMSRYDQFDFLPESIPSAEVFYTAVDKEVWFSDDLTRKFKIKDMGHIDRTFRIMRLTKK